MFPTKLAALWCRPTRDKFITSLMDVTAIKRCDVTEVAISAHLGQPSPDDDGCLCTADYRPVCASVNGVESTYGNQCAAECEYVSLYVFLFICLSVCVSPHF